MGAEKSASATLIQARWVAPMAAGAGVIGDGAVVFESGRIVAVGEAAHMHAAYPHAARIERPTHLLCPGLVNAHTQCALTLLRGAADDIPHSQWLRDVVWPAQRRWGDDNFVRDGTALALCEMLRGGTTCVNDAYAHSDAVAREFDRLGVRGRIAIAVDAQPSSWAASPAEYLEKGLAVRDHYRDHPRLSFTFAPAAPGALDEDTLRRVCKLSDQLEEPVQTVVHETRAEIQQCLSDHGERPLPRLGRLGFVSPALMAVHAVHLDDDEIRALADGGAHVVHCPQSNLKLASGLCPLAALLERGINVALGTGAAASNNRLDMLGEMRAAALLAKGVSGSATSVSAARALEMATLGGARALGLSDEIGSLQAGKCADLICVDLSDCATQPVYDPLTALVYAAGREHVSDVWVGGRARVREGELIAADERQIVDNANAWAEKIGSA